jgi:hypothetical protein
VYLSNFNKITIISRHTGNKLRSINLIERHPYFILDSQNNIIQVCTHEGKIKLYNSDLEFLNESLYENEFDTVEMTNKNELAFVDLKNNSITYV